MDESNLIELRGLYQQLAARDAEIARLRALIANAVNGLGPLVYDENGYVSHHNAVKILEQLLAALAAPKELKCQ